MRYMMPYGGKWMEWTDEEMEAMSEDDREDIAHHYGRYKDNMLANFLPHGGGRDFLNDIEHGVVFLTAGNRNGKTYHGAAFTALRICRCDETWATFKQNGVNFIPWDGAKEWIVSSYSWDSVDVVWRTYRELFPRAELGPYAPGWPRRDFGERGPAKFLAFGDGRPKQLPLLSGSIITFLCYTQTQDHWESRRADGMHSDEQISREKFVGYSMRTMTMGTKRRKVQACMTLTGHVLDDRPDTGSGGFCHRMYNGQETTQFSVGKYRIGIADVPDCIITAEKKAAMKREWEDEPRARGDLKKLREGEARYHGGWEASSGLMLDEWMREVHVIPRLWKDGETPKDCTLYRFGDHGESSPTCFLWIALFSSRNRWTPYSFAVVYRCFYESSQIAKTCQKVIEMSGNRRVKVSEAWDDVTGRTYDVYNEIEEREQYWGTMLDPRSRSMPKDGLTIGAIYSRWGLECQSGPGFNSKDGKNQWAFLRDWLRIDYEKKHIITKKPGAPRLYVFDGACRPLVEEIEGLQRDTTDGDKPRKGSIDHAVEALRRWAAQEPQADDFMNAPMDRERQDDERQTTVGAAGAPNMGY